MRDWQWQAIARVVSGLALAVILSGCAGNSTWNLCHDRLQPINAIIAPAAGIHPDE